MNCVIIEDEKPAAEKLLSLLALCNQQVYVEVVLGSVKEAISWLQEYPTPEVDIYGYRARVMGCLLKYLKK